MNYTLTKRQSYLWLFAALLICVGLYGLTQMPTEPNSEEKTADVVNSRDDAIKAQFNSWSGEHIKLKKEIQKLMHDPDSFDLIEAKYLDNGKTIYVQMEFTGANIYGGKVRQIVKASVTLNGDIIEMWEVK